MGNTFIKNRKTKKWAKIIQENIIVYLSKTVCLTYMTILSQTEGCDAKITTDWYTKKSYYENKIYYPEIFVYFVFIENYKYKSVVTVSLTESYDSDSVIKLLFDIKHEVYKIKKVKHEIEGEKVLYDIVKTIKLDEIRDVTIKFGENELKMIDKYVLYFENVCKNKEFI